MALRVADEPRAGRERAQALAVVMARGVRDRRERDERDEDRGECPADGYPSTLA
jgi:hypothetical protein